MESTRQNLLRVSRRHRRDREAAWRSLRRQAQKAERYKRYKAELQGPRAVVGGAAVARAPGRGEVAGRGARRRARSSEARRTTLDGRGDVGRGRAPGGRPRRRTSWPTAKDELFALSNRAQLGDAAGRSTRIARPAQLDGARRGGAREIERARERASRAGRRASTEIGRRSWRDDRRGGRARGGRRTRAGGARRRPARRRWPRRARALDEARGRAGRGAGATSRAARRSARRPSRGATISTCALEGIGDEEAAAAERDAALAGERRSVCSEKLGELRRARRAHGAPASSRRGAAGGRSRASLARRARARDAARGGPPAPLAPGVADGDPGPLRGLPEGRARHHAGTARRARRVAGIRGVVADIVQPPPELETAVEAVLGERLGNIIVESHEVGIEAIEFLKQKSEGRSSFIPSARCAARVAMAARRRARSFDARRRHRRDGRSLGRDARAHDDARRRRLAEGRRRARADARAHRLRPEYDEVAAYLLGRRAGGRGPATARWSSGARRGRRRRSSPSTAR